MTLRKPNLLDAFQASAPEGRKSASRSNGGAAAGPFAGEGYKGPADIVLPAARKGFWERVLGERVVQLALLGSVLAVVAAYWFGQRSAQPEPLAQAAAEDNGGALLPEKAAPPRDPDLADANQRTAAAGSTHDEQFLDPANRFTVRVASFPADEAGKRAALEHRDYLRGEGAPVIQPIQKGRMLVLCVGHEPGMEEAKRLLSYAKGLRGPKGSKKPPYQDAYIDNIDNVVARKK
jgi:hypothetical protein